MIWRIEPIPAGEARRLLPLVEQVQALHADAEPYHFRDDSHPYEILQDLTVWLEKDGVTALGAVSPEEHLLGYAIFSITDHGAHPLRRSIRRGFLHHLGVDEAQRGQGIGAALVEEVKARLRAAGVERLASSHFAFNDASAALLRKAGLRPLHVTVEGLL